MPATRDNGHVDDKLLNDDDDDAVSMRNRCQSQKLHARMNSRGLLCLLTSHDERAAKSNSTRSSFSTGWFKK